MKIVIAIDSFKGSLSSIEAGQAIREGICSVLPDAEVVLKPLADGGEGTVEAFLEGAGASEVRLPVMGPLGRPVACRYAVLRDGRTAVIEVAAAAGLTQVPDPLRNPLNVTSYGVGEAIRDAIGRGCRSFIVGMGGSATNDGGVGMLEALGFVFKDENGEPVGPYGKDVSRIAAVDRRGILPQLQDCRFVIACDVNNPLCGERGASAVFGPQKGATPEMVRELDQSLFRFSEVTKRELGRDVAELEGTGAAGGLGYAFTAYLGAERRKGIELVLEAVGMEAELSDTDIVVTGEGRMDVQTAMGKAPVGVARLAKEYGCIVIAFAGAVTSDARECNEAGIDAYFPIVRGPVSLMEAMDPEQAKRNLQDAVRQVFGLIAAEQKRRKSKKEGQGVGCVLLTKTTV